MTPTLTTAPALVNLKGPAGFPFSLTLNISATDNVGNPVPWSGFSLPQVFLSSIYSTIPSADFPTITSPASGQYQISWTAAQTIALAKVRGLRWYFAASINGMASDFLAGSLQFVDPSLAQPSGTTYAVSVSVGTDTVNLAVAIGGGGGGGGGGDTAFVVDAIVTGAMASILSNHYAPVDATIQPCVLALPNAPADKTRCGAKMVITSGSNTVQIARSGSDVINKPGGSTVYPLSTLNQGVILQYSAATHIWTALSDDLALPQLDARYVLATAIGHDPDDLSLTITGSF